LAGFSGKRSVTQWQAIPVAAQLNAASPSLTERQPGGVIDFDRHYQGLDGRLVWRWALGGVGAAQLVTGLAAEESREDRRGFENFSGPVATRLLGVTGRLRRDELNRVRSTDAYAQAEFEFTPHWAATLGLRGGRVAFRSEDRYVVGGNLDDSGALSYRYANPVAAVQWRASEQFKTYISLGRGFESPTLNELAYRPDGGSGFSTGLKPQTSRQLEVGAKWRPAGPRLTLDAAVFEARSADEIGVATNLGGRSTFRNLGRTARRGAELSLNAQLAADWHAQLATTWLSATYSDGFAVCASVPCATPSLPVPAGNLIAGTLARSAYAELTWAPLRGVELAAEARGQGRLPVNDLNSDFAAGFGLLALRARWQVDAGNGRLELLARVDNLADRTVVGSVIVNEGNGRYFEPAAGRTWLISARWNVRF
jgi:iron complex outermembrane receptor protein